MSDKYITPFSKHSALLIIDVQRDFTLKGGVALKYQVPYKLFVISSP
jgi:hypothetical protein